MKPEFKGVYDWPQIEVVKCPIRFSLEILAGKWRLPIICSLAGSAALRWGELKRQLPGITNTMLAGSLAELQSAGLVERTQYNEMPLRVEYALSETGRKLSPILYHLGQWGLEVLKAKPEARLNGKNTQPVQLDEAAP